MGVGGIVVLEMSVERNVMALRDFEVILICIVFWRSMENSSAVSFRYS